MYDARKQMIEDIIENMNKEINGRKNRQQQNTKINIVEIGESILQCSHDHYESAIKKEVEPFLAEIRINLEVQCKKLST